MNYFVGAYAASANIRNWNPAVEEELFAGLAAMTRIRGLEIPFYGGIHRFDADWFLEHVKADWELVLTCIPGTMERLQERADFGLASESSEGRAAAIEFARQAHHTVLEINGRLSRACVKAVVFHSAPRQGVAGVRSSTDSFARSLEEIGSWNWGGTRLLIEHCDRYVEGQAPAKGFLSLVEETQAVEGKDFKIILNWGRSALEARDPDAPLAQVVKLTRAGLLGGIIFSGVTADDPHYGSWADSHAPFQVTCPRSLLTSDRARAVLRAFRKSRAEPTEPAGSTEPMLVGIKIQTLPQTLTIPERLAVLARSLQHLESLEP